MESNDHHRYRLDIDVAKEEIYREISEIDSDEFKYIYLFGFDYEDRLVWGDVLRTDDPESQLNLIIAMAEELDERIENVYFIIKVKSFSDYFEGYTDMAGTMESVRGFIKAWKGFEERKGGSIPALKRYTIEFINHNLGLPFRYSEKQRNLDMEELLSREK